jgi:plasmid stabilization system protein ParE
MTAVTEEQATQLSDQLAAFCNEAAELRASPGPSDINETLPDLHARLVRSRQAQDRIEEILGLIIRLRGVTRKRARACKDELEDKLGRVIRGTKTAEYSTAREREAAYEVGAFEEKRAWRAAEKMLANVEMAYEFVQLKHRGIDTARRDIETRVRIVSLDGRLGG